MTRMRTARRWTGGLVALALAAGCASSGPRTIPNDRVNYQEALSSSAKTQLLLNLVRVRYVDPPIFLEVASIVNSYSWDAGVNAGGSSGRGPRTYGVDANGAYGDHPTISYSPLSGEKFSRSMMTPLTPQAVLSLVQVGYPVDAVFRLCVKSVNGVFNQSGASSLKRPADPSFVPLLEALRRIQLSGAVALRVEKHGDEETALVVMRAGHSAELEADRDTVARILGLEKADEYKVVFGMLLEPRRRDRAPDTLDARDHGGARRGHRRAGEARSPSSASLRRRRSTARRRCRRCSASAAPTRLRPTPSPRLDTGVAVSGSTTATSRRNGSSPS